MSFLLLGEFQTQEWKFRGQEEKKQVAQIVTESIKMLTTKPALPPLSGQQLVLYLGGGRGGLPGSVCV